MGVKITQILHKREIELRYLTGRTIGIDAFNWIYAFLTTIKDRETFQPLQNSAGIITSHLSGLLYRTSKLIENNIKPCYVFDGKPPKFKEETSRARRVIRENAEIRLQKAIEKGDKEEARKAAQQAVRITQDIIDNAKLLLDYMGVPYVQAESEGEAQLAHMTMNKVVNFSASQDADTLLFGSPALVRNLNIVGRRKIPGKNFYREIKPDLILLDQALKEMGITRDQLIYIGLLVGTDFNKGIKGIGPKTALKIVKSEKTLTKIIKKAIDKNPWEGPDPKDVFNFFKKPPVQNVKIKFGDVQEDKLMKLMVDKFEFMEERIQKVIDRLKGGKKQNSLSKWL